MIGSWMDSQLKLQTVWKQIDNAVRWPVFDLYVRLQIFKENQFLTSPKGDREGWGVGESKAKQNLFSEGLAIAFPIAILQIDYGTAHITLLTNLLVGCQFLVTVLINI